MFNKNSAQSTFMDSIHGLANVLAATVAFFGTGPIYERTIGWVMIFTARHYGAEFTDFASFAWFVLIAFLVFFTARASLSTLLVMGGLAIAVRFL